VEAQLVDRLLDMLKDSSTTEQHYQWIIEIVSNLTREPESTAAAVVEENILNSVDELLRSGPTHLYKHIFPMLERLAFHKSTVTGVLDMRLYDLLATLWRYVCIELHIS
jgi:hypothetical protein